MIDIKTYQPIAYSDLIERVWFLENTYQELELLCPPDPYVNLIIPLSGSHWHRNGVKLNCIQIEGLNLQTTINKYPKKTRLLGIRFYPFGLSAFSPISGKETLDKLIPFNEVFQNPNSQSFSKIELDSNLETLIQNCYALLDDNFDEKRYQKHQIIRDFYQYYRQEKQMGSIEAFSQQFSTNYSTLNRQFTKTIGLSSKQFERLIKFRKALCSLTDSADKLNHIGLDSGYFDQSHFIREFKLFMNSSPSAYHKLIKKADQESKIVNYNFRLF